MKRHSLALIGAGTRGWRLARLAAEHAERAHLSAVADPVPGHREAFAKELSIPPGRCFASHAELLRECRDLDGAIVSSPVAEHAQAACDCLEAGVAVFLEKPMALNVTEAKRIVHAAERTGVRLQVGFNCRYAPFHMALKQVVAEGKLGQVLSIEWKEALAPSHWAEYCRHPTYSRRSALGSWLLEKCCHDIDLINWVVDAQCVRVASFGSRSHFAPRPDVPRDCSPECPIESECLFSAAKLYGEAQPDPTGQRRHMPHVCVYHSGADLVDHQTALLEYDNGVTVVFSLLPLTHLQTRFVHICGSDATLRGCWTLNELRLHPYRTSEEVVCDPAPATGGHGGADPQIILAFLDWLDDEGCRPKTTGAEGLEAMVVCMGIDLAMRERRVVELTELRDD